MDSGVMIYRGAIARGHGHMYVDQVCKVTGGGAMPKVGGGPNIDTNNGCQGEHICLGVCT